MHRRDFMNAVLASGLVGTGAVPGRFGGKAEKPEILLNQAGYITDGQKIVVVRGGYDSIIVLENDERAGGSLAFKLSKPRFDGQTGQHLRYADLSGFREPGVYRLRAGRAGSASLTISDSPFDGVFRRLLRAYYLQRCGTPLSDDETGLRHDACHRNDGIVFRGDRIFARGRKLNATGGWHDAGDFGKYVATTAVAIGRILTLYEDFPDLFHDGQLNIPESGNGREDVLDEMLVGLSWMLTMQRPDGAVYRKLSGLSWPAAVVPERDEQARYLFGVSTPETAKFAAAMALASRTYFHHLPDRATDFQDAAIRAWNFLETMSGRQYIDWSAEDDVGSGPYIASENDPEKSLVGDTDDRLWAAAELYRTTKDRRFLRSVERIYRDGFGLFEWKDPSVLGLTGLLFDRDPTGELEPLKGRIRRALLQRADKLVISVERSGFGIANSRFIWGSNKITAEEGITLCHAYRATGERRYLNAAGRQCDYLLGCNPFGVSFVTGVGSKSVNNVAHLFARAVGKNIPGLLVGGPNERAQDGVAPKNSGPLSYVDSELSYATNEPAIDYNSSLIALIGYISKRNQS